MHLLTEAYIGAFWAYSVVWSLYQGLLGPFRGFGGLYQGLFGPSREFGDLYRSLLDPSRWSPFGLSRAFRGLYQSMFGLCIGSIQESLSPYLTYLGLSRGLGGLCGLIQWGGGDVRPSQGAFWAYSRGLEAQFGPFNLSHRVMDPLWGPLGITGRLADLIGPNWTYPGELETYTAGVLNNVASRPVWAYPGGHFEPIQGGLEAQFGGQTRGVR